MDADEQSESEPAFTACSAELSLFSGVLSRGIVTRSRWGLATKEVDVHLADEPAAEFGVANARPLVRRRRVLASDPRRNIVGYDQRGRLGEDPGLGDGSWSCADVAEGVHVGEPGPEVGLVDGHPAVYRPARGRARIGRPVHRGSYA